MSNVNLIVLMGNLVKNPELRNLAGSDSKAVCEVPVAVNERYTRDGETVESVSFIDVTFWGRTAEVVCEYLRKGSPVHIQGRLKQDRWEKDGEPRSKLKVVCEKMTMVGSRRKESDDAAGGEDQQPVALATADEAPY